MTGGAAGPSQATEGTERLLHAWPSPPMTPARTLGPRIVAS